MEVLGRHSGNNAYGTLFDYADGYLNFRDVFFGCGVVNTFFPYELVYSIFKLNVYEDSLYYHATSEIYFHN